MTKDPLMVNLKTKSTPPPTVSLEALSPPKVKHVVEKFGASTIFTFLIHVR